MHTLNHIQNFVIIFKTKMKISENTANYANFIKIISLSVFIHNYDFS